MLELVQRALPLGIAAPVLLALGHQFRRRPVVAAVTWLAAIVLVPSWFAVDIGLTVGVSVGISAVAVLALLPGAPVRWSLLDAWVGLAMLACAAPWIVGATSAAQAYEVVTLWLLPYILARALAARAGSADVALAFVLAMCLAAVLGLLELVTGFNPFITMSDALGMNHAWSKVQLRGGVPRSEGAFGHSIALGSALALAIPFALTSRRLRPALRAMAALLLLGGTVSTLSRAALACAALGLVLTALLHREVPRRTRWISLGGAVGGSALVLPSFTSIFDAAGSEAAESAAYRGDLLRLVNDFAAVGATPNLQRSAVGATSYDGFGSIDNALILLGLRSGWLPLTVCLALLMAAVLAVAVRRAGAGAIAICAHVPALVSVALLTQYTSVFWFVAGLAVVTQQSLDEDPHHNAVDSFDSRVWRRDHSVSPR